MKKKTYFKFNSLNSPLLPLIRVILITSTGLSRLSPIWMKDDRIQIRCRTSHSATTGLLWLIAIWLVVVVKLPSEIRVWKVHFLFRYLRPPKASGVSQKNKEEIRHSDLSRRDSSSSWFKVQRHTIRGWHDYSIILRPKPLVWSLIQWERGKGEHCWLCN